MRRQRAGFGTNAVGHHHACPRPVGQLVPPVKAYPAPLYGYTPTTAIPKVNTLTGNAIARVPRDRSLYKAIAPRAPSR